MQKVLSDPEEAGQKARFCVEEKKLYIVNREEHKVIDYDFCFSFCGETHFMCFAHSKVYVLKRSGTIWTSNLQLNNDVLMVLEHGNYAYTPVRDCPVKTEWYKAYSNWIAEKEILGG